MSKTAAEFVFLNAAEFVKHLVSGHFLREKGTLFGALAKTKAKSKTCVCVDGEAVFSSLGTHTHCLCLLLLFILVVVIIFLTACVRDVRAGTGVRVRAYVCAYARKARWFLTTDFHGLGGGGYPWRSGESVGGGVPSAPF